MKSIATTIFLVTALFSIEASAGVTVNLAECMQTHVVDGREQKTSSGNSIALDNGTHQMVVSCTVPLGRSDDDSFPEASDTFVLQFTAADVELTLSAPTIRTLREMERFNEKGDFRLVTASGEPVKYHAHVLKKEGFQVFRDYVAELEAFNRSSAAAALTAGVAAGASNSDPTPSARDRHRPPYEARGQEIPNQEMVSQMLRYWYLEADMKTRNEFKGWMQTSDQAL